MKSPALIVGRVITGLIVLFMLVDSIGKVARFGPYVEGTVSLGYPADVVPILGIIALVSTLAYAIPSTAGLGAILLTAYLGGATATHVRAGLPVWFPLVLGILVWGALYLRDERVRTLIPLRR